jgi:hypothetical protein
MAAIRRKTYTTTPLCCSVDVDALELVDAMLGSRVGIGRLISELLRKEAHERLARADQLERLRQGAGQVEHAHE